MFEPGLAVTKAIQRESDGSNVKGSGDLGIWIISFNLTEPLFSPEKKAEPVASPIVSGAFTHDVFE